MKKAVLLIVLAAFFTGCIAENPDIEQAYENSSPSGADMSTPVIVQELPAMSKPDFSLINHSMQLSNPIWKTPVKFNLSVEKGIDAYRANITIRAFYAALYELQNITNFSLSFAEVPLEEAGLAVEINTSLKHIKADALGISLIEQYAPRENYNEILKARIALTPIYSCAAKIEALHELLHILGFGHSSETNSIMYKYGAVCTSRMTGSIKQALNALYSYNLAPV